MSAPEAAGKGTDALLVQIGISSRKSCLKWLLLLGLQCTWTVWTVMLIRNKEEVHIAPYYHVSRVTSHVTNLGSLLFLIRTLPRSTASPPATSPPGHSPPGHQRYIQLVAVIASFWAIILGKNVFLPFSCNAMRPIIHSCSLQLFHFACRIAGENIEQHRRISNLVSV